MLYQHNKERIIYDTPQTSKPEWVCDTPHSKSLHSLIPHGTPKWQLPSHLAAVFGKHTHSLQSYSFYSYMGQYIHTTGKHKSQNNGWTKSHE